MSDKDNVVVKLIKQMRDFSDPIAWNLGIPIGQELPPKADEMLAAIKNLDEADVPQNKRMLWVDGKMYPQEEGAYQRGVEDGKKEMLEGLKSQGYLNVVYCDGGLPRKDYMVCTGDGAESKQKGWLVFIPDDTPPTQHETQPERNLRG